MKNSDKQPSVFPSAKEDKELARKCHTPHDSYHLAYADEEFLLRDDLRAVRLQLEWLKPDLILEEHGIESTVVIFGGARFGEQTPSHSHYYQEARALAKQITERSRQAGGSEYVVMTGGGPGVMEAANRGAADAGGKTIGLNIVLPYEQTPNPYITPELCFQFHYFAIRKMHFLKRAKGLAAFPGGFGTLDELFETLTLVQTRKIRPLPVVLVGKDYWSKVINFDFLVEQGAIKPEDLDLFHTVDTAREAYDYLASRWDVMG